MASCPNYETIEIRAADVIQQVVTFDEFFDLSEQYDFRIRSQGGFPTCSACSVLTCIEYLRQIDGYDYESFSLAYHYYMTRIIDGDEKKIVAVNLESSFKSLIQNGASESLFVPTTDETLNTTPSFELMNIAKRRILDVDIAICKLDIDLNVFKYVLCILQIPFVIAFRTPREKISSKKPCIITKDPDDVNTGYHAVCVVGYDDVEQVLIFQNSYGEKWKYGGFGKLHYSCLTNITHAITLNQTCVKSDECTEIDYNSGALALLNILDGLMLDGNCEI